MNIEKRIWGKYMSDDCWKTIDSYGVNPASYNIENKQKASTKSSVKILKILLCTLIAVVVVQLVAYFVIIPSTNAYSVNFEGANTVSVTELQSIITQTCGNNWIQFDTTKAASALLSVSTIESATVQKSFPNKILVTVQERNPVAIALVTINNRTTTVQVDSDGVIFSAMDVAADQNLPLITGWNIGTFYKGMVVDGKYHTLLQQIAAINDTNPEYFSVISEISIQEKEYDNFELVIYPVHTRTRVLLDRNLNKDVLEYMLIALDVVNSVSPNVKELDLRYGSISYKLEV